MDAEEAQEIALLEFAAPTLRRSCGRAKITDKAEEKGRAESSEEILSKHSVGVLQSSHNVEAYDNTINAYSLMVASRPDDLRYRAYLRLHVSGNFLDHRIVSLCNVWVTVQGRTGKTPHETSLTEKFILSQSIWCEICSTQHSMHQVSTKISCLMA